MNKHLKSILSLAIAAISINVNAQVQKMDRAKVGDNTTPIEASAVLQAQSTTQGMLTPRMTEAQRTAIASPANGLLVYQTDATAGFYFFDGTAWKPFGSESWSLNGNIIADTNFIGSTNNKPLNFKVNNGTKLQIGSQTLPFDPAGWNSILFATDTLTTNTGARTTFSNILNVNVPSANGQFRGLNNYVFYENSLSNVSTIGGVNEIQFSPTSSGTSPSNIASFSAIRNNSTSTTVQSAITYNTSVTNAGIIRDVVGLNVNELNATGSDAGFNHIVRGININSNLIASGGNKNLVYPLFSSNTNSSYMAGGLGIGVQSAADFKPHTSALVEVQSTTQGFLPPRMTAVQMNAIATPAEGLVVYCTNCLATKGLRVFDGANWITMDGNTAPAAAFTFTGNYYHLPNFHAGKVMGTDNTLFLEVNVTTIGEIAFSSGTANGYSFSGFAQVSATGIQYVPVNPTGTQTAYSSSGDAFTISGVGTTTQTQAVTIVHSVLGSNFTAFSNGTENFSNNTACASKPVSTTTSGNCPATVTVGSNTYNTVFINGQCWFKENLKEVSTAPCGDAINSGCNTWLNTNSTDLGRWGYYNNTTSNGTAGWRTTEPAAGEGLLYQWSAAMNGSTAERAKGVCPAGWHIPSDCEFMYLEHGLGMSIAQQTMSFGSSTTRVTGDVGGKLATYTRATSASANGTGSNSSGFTALGAGYRQNSSGAFAARGSRVNLWSSTTNGALDAVQRGLYSNGSGVEKSNFTRSFGATVRCLKD